MNMDSLVLSLLCSNCVALQVASYDLLLRCLRDEKMLSKLVQTGKETTGPSTTEIEIAFPKNLQQILDDMELKLSFSEQPVPCIPLGYNSLQGEQTTGLFASVVSLVGESSGSMHYCYLAYMISRIHHCVRTSVST